MTNTPRRSFDDLIPAQQAGIMCNDPRFQQFVGARTIDATVKVLPAAAAEYVRTICKITSRRDLNTCPAALAQFNALRTEFDAWTGKIADQR
jgi:hypothetical protein